MTTPAFNAGLYYLDTNPLVTYAEAEAGVGEVDELKVKVLLDELIARGDCRVAASPVTILEFYDQLARIVRSHKDERLDQTWMDRHYLNLMEWTERGHLAILEMPSRLYERALQLVEMVHREKGQSLKSWDAAHLELATDWSRSEGKNVQIVTHDSDFSKFVSAMPGYSAHISLLDLLAP